MTFQLWLSADADVVVWADSLPEGVTAYRFSFDGLGPGEVQTVTRVIAGCIADPNVQPVGLVIDRTGAGADVDWNAAMGERIRHRVRMQADVFLAP